MIEGRPPAGIPVAVAPWRFALLSFNPLLTASLRARCATGTCHLRCGAQTKIDRFEPSGQRIVHHHEVARGRHRHLETHAHELTFSDAGDRRAVGISLVPTFDL